MSRTLTSTGLTDESVCPTCGTGGPRGYPACQPILSRLLTRREWLAGLAGTALLTGCGEERPIIPSMVSIVRAPAYDQRLYETVRRMLEEHRLEVRGRNVVLKPNLVEFEPGSSINTHPLLVHAAFEAFRG